MIEVSKTIVFDAAHHLPETPPDHKCSGMHGHTWKLRVWVTGDVDPVKGWIVDFHELDRICHEHAISKLDHKVMNLTIHNPTTEHLAMWIYGAVAEPIAGAGARVTRIEIQEGEDCWCTLTIPAPQAEDA